MPEPSPSRYLYGFMALCLGTGAAFRCAEWYLDCTHFKVQKPSTKHWLLMTPSVTIFISIYENHSTPSRVRRGINKERDVLSVMFSFPDEAKIVGLLLLCWQRRAKPPMQVCPDLRGSCSSGKRSETHVSRGLFAV